MLEWNPFTIMNYGGGTPSTTLVLMACENKLAGRPIHALVPEYDYVLFCDLHAEPSWVYHQAAFVSNVCAKAGINFITLDADLYGDFTQNFGKRRVVAIPFWTVAPDGKLGKMPRQCTCDYKNKKWLSLLVSRAGKSNGKCQSVKKGSPEPPPTKAETKLAKISRQVLCGQAVVSA